MLIFHKKLFLITQLIACLCLTETNSIGFDMGEKTFDNFGPFDVELEGVKKCNGPKSKSLGTFDVWTENDSTGKQAIAVINFTMLEPGRIDEVKIIMNSIKEKETKQLWNYRIHKPCQHFALAATIEQTLNNKNCFMKKGTYLLTMNYLEYTKTFFGTSFFFGRFHLKIMSLSSKGNLLCIEVDYTFKKKQKT